MKLFCKILCISTLSLFLGICGFFLLYNNEDLKYQTATINDNFIYQSHPILINDYICQQYPNSNNFTTDTTNYFSSPIDYTNGHMIVDVVMLAFAESPNYFDEPTYKLMYSGLQTVHDYYNTYSYGRLNIEFNVYIYQSNIKQSSIENSKFDYDKEIYMHSSGINNGEIICEVNGTPNAKILILGMNDYFDNNQKTLLPWPHAWSGKNTKLITLSSTLITSLNHEIGHFLNLNDLYNNSGTPNFCPDLMGVGSFLTPISAHNRYCLGWLTKSYANDNLESNIEIIEDEGTYTINTPEKNGVIAYQIGVEKEYFLVEIRNQFFGVDNYYLTVQKVNTNYNTNLNATSSSNSFIYFIKTSKPYTSEFGDEGSAFLDLKYSKNISSGYSIINILKLDNGAYQFDFVKQTDSILNGKIFAKNNLNNILNNAKISLNNQVLTNNGIANSNFDFGDVVDIVCDGYQSKKLEINPNIFNFTNRNIDIILYKQGGIKEDSTLINGNSSNITTTHIFEIFVLANQTATKYDNDCEILFNRTKQNITGSFSINLTNGDYFEIKSSKTTPLFVSYNNNNLYVSGGQIETKYGISKLILNLQEQAYYFNVYDCDNNTLDNISIQIFNSQNGKWENVLTYQLYDYNNKIYAINNITSKYTKAKITYNSFGTTSEKIIDINNTQNYYYVEITKNIIQSAGDFFINGLKFITNLWK